VYSSVSSTTTTTLSCSPPLQLCSSTMRGPTHHLHETCKQQATKQPN
jgi:hypothetical protein